METSQYIPPIFDSVPTKFASEGTRPRHSDAMRPDATTSRSRDLKESTLLQSQHRRSSFNISDDELRHWLQRSQPQIVWILITAFNQYNRIL